MLDENDITNEAKRAIIAQEIAMYKNSIYLFTVRYRVNKKLGNEEQMKLCQSELEKCEQALDILRTNLDEIEKSEEKELQDK